MRKLFRVFSGWFSIKLTKRGMANLVFQLLFYSTVIYCAFIVFGGLHFSIKSFVKHADSLSNFWFVRAYIPLFLLSPILNVFIDCAGKKTVKTTLLCYAFLEIVMGWFVDLIGIDGGYSFFHLCFIYLIARYIRVYGGKYFMFDKLHDLSIYLLISIGTAVVVFLSAFVAPTIWRHGGRMFLYNAPLVLAATIYLSLFFTKLDFKSKIVNMLGASSFAVFLIHGDPLITAYTVPICNNLFANHDIVYYSVVISLAIIALFMVAFVVDLVRQWLWLKIQAAFF